MEIKKVEEAWENTYENIQGKRLNFKAWKNSRYPMKV